MYSLFFSAQKNAFLYSMQIYAGVVIRNLLKYSNIIEKPKTKFKFSSKFSQTVENAHILFSTSIALMF